MRHAHLGGACVGLNIRRGGDLFKICCSGGISLLGIGDALSLTSPLASGFSSAGYSKKDENVPISRQKR